ncbi:MAG: hypothetical protein AAFY76_01945 [Cyanobacteria bacterium J06649_11]
MAEINFMHDDVAALTMNVRVFNGGNFKLVIKRCSPSRLTTKHTANWPGSISCMTMSLRGSIKWIMNRFLLYGLNPKYVALSAQINSIFNNVAARQCQVRHEKVCAFRAHARTHGRKAEFNFIKERFTAWLNQKELSILLRASMK